MIQKQFEKYFMKAYLSEKYYDGKIKYFHEYKLGKLTMDAYAKRFLELLRYVPYLKDEKARIQCSLSGLPQSYHDRIEFENPKTPKNTIRKAKCCYDQSKHMQDPLKDWKRKDNPGFQRKRFKPSQYKNPKEVLSSVI
jgi:hypothetical protein